MVKMVGVVVLLQIKVLQQAGVKKDLGNFFFDMPSPLA